MRFWYQRPASPPWTRPGSKRKKVVDGIPRMVLHCTVIMSTKPKPKSPVGRKRVESGLSQYALAKVTGTTPSHIKRIENGECVPGVELAIAISEALGTTVETIFTKRARAAA